MKKLVFILSLSACLYNAFAQDIIVTNEGEAIKGYNTDCSAEWIYYNPDSTQSILNKIACKDVIAIKKANGEKIIPGLQGKPTHSSENHSQTERVLTQSEKDSIINAVKNYTGFLLAKGNNVYVIHNSKKKYEKAGQEVIYEALKKEHFWNLVEDPHMAHFALQYNMDTRSSDHAWLGILYHLGQYNKNGKPVWIEYQVAHQNNFVNEKITQNEKIARDFVEKLKDLIQVIEEDKIPRELRKACR